MNESGNPIERKLDIVISLLIGMMSALMAITILFSGENHGGMVQDMSVLLAALAYFATAMYLRKIIS